MSLQEGEGPLSFRGDTGNNVDSDANSNAVCFTDFTFQYKAQSLPTLYGINLAVRRGEKILIAGPSGCGKSTLAHCINGLIPHAYKGAVQGSLTIMGKDALKQDLFTRSGTIGTVLQDTDGQFVGLTAAEDIAFAAENDCAATAEMHRGAVEAAKLVHIEDHLNKSPQVLSGGQKQRVSLAGLLMNEVEILLFDEPLANLDPATGREAIELIDKLHRDTGKTVIMVEHRLEDALHRPVDRIVVMEEGRIIADLPPAEILAKDILRKTGIREPLYLSALRYSGAVITAETGPESPETVSFDPLLLSDWERSLPEEAPEPVRTELLSVKSLSFRYPLTGTGGLNSPPALRDISFAIGSGDCIALAGKNGAGKSTLAKLISGFVRPDTGELRFKGEDLAGLSIRERAEHIGYVMQNPNQMISFPLIFDEAAFALRNRGMGETEIRDRVFESLRICGLYPFRNWPVSALSYGQKKRLTIASILVIRPELLILDEPTAGQDFRHYTEIMEFLGKLNREQGITLLIITHDMHLMLEYARRTLVVAEGKLLADAPPAEILTEKALIEEANLKRTSLYDLALRAHFKNPRAFVGRFISFERNLREAGLKNSDTVASERPGSGAPGSGS